MREAALDAGSARGTVAASSVDGTVDAQVALELTADEVRLAGEASVSGPISADLGVVLVDDVVYLRVPPLFQFFTSAPWVRLPQDGSGELAEQTEGLVDAFAAEVPGDSLLDPDGGYDDADVRFLGGDTVNGTAVERYEVSASISGVDVSRTYWVDADDLLLRLDSTADDPAEPQPAVSTTIYDEWGVPVLVEAPDPAEVGEFPEGFF